MVSGHAETREVVTRTEEGERDGDIESNHAGFGPLTEPTNLLRTSRKVCNMDGSAIGNGCKSSEHNFFFVGTIISQRKKKETGRAVLSVHIGSCTRL